MKRRVKYEMLTWSDGSTFQIALLCWHGLNSNCSHLVEKIGNLRRQKTKKRMKMK